VGVLLGTPGMFGGLRENGTCSSGLRDQGHGS
jgi:hypothetical protein